MELLRGDEEGVEKNENTRTKYENRGACATFSLFIFSGDSLVPVRCNRIVYDPDRPRDRSIRQTPEWVR
jgi:hypothetical protein